MKWQARPFDIKEWDRIIVIIIIIMSFSNIRVLLVRKLLVF